MSDPNEFMELYLARVLIKKADKGNFAQELLNQIQLEEDR